MKIFVTEKKLWFGGALVWAETLFPTHFWEKCSQSFWIRVWFKKFDCHANWKRHKFVTALRHGVIYCFQSIFENNLLSFWDLSAIHIWIPIERRKYLHFTKHFCTNHMYLVINKQILSIEAEFCNLLFLLKNFLYFFKPFSGKKGKHFWR